MYDNKREELHWIDEEEKTRAYMRKTFFDNDEGLYVLCSILDKTGNFKTDKDEITPELIALGSWIMNKCGISTPFNFMEMVKAMGTTINNEDLLLMRRELRTEENNNNVET